MTPKEIYKFIIEQSPEPLIKNPVLREVVDQERLGFYLGKKVPSQGTLEDADTKKAEDALSGVNETMKIADLQRQGHIGHYYADGGEVIGKPGGLVEPGITHYAVRKTRSGTEISDEKTKKFKYPYTNQHGTFYRAEPKGVSNPTAKQIEIAEKVHGKKYKGKKGINLWRALKQFERSNIVQKHTTGGTKLKKNMLSKQSFTDLVNANTDKTIDEFVEVLKDYKTKDGKTFKYQTVVDRVRDYGLTGKLKSKKSAPYTKKEVFALSTEQSLKDYKKGKIDYEKLKARAIDRAASQNRSEEAKEKRRTRQKIYRTGLLKTEEGRERLKAQSRKQKAKEYLIEGLDPPATTAEQAIWKDAVTTAKKNKDGKGRFSFDSGYSKSMKGKDFYAGKIKIKDNQTGKTFSFNTFKNYINNNAESFGIEGYRDAMKPYRQKYFINEIPNLRNNLAEALIPGWKGGDKRTAVTIQHDFGRQNNPLKASIAFWDANEQEYKVKDKFERAWAQNVGEDGKIKVTPEIKKAYKEYTSDIAKKNIISKPSMVKRDRTFGKGLDLTETLKIAKERGATIPQGTFKKAKEFEKQIANNLNKAGFDCEFAGSSGGLGSCDDPRSYRKSMQETMQKASQGDNAAVRRIQNLGKIMNTIKGAAKATGYGALIEIGFAAPLATIDWARGANKQEIVSNATLGFFGKSMDEQLRDKDLRYKQIAALEDAGTKEEKMRKRLETAGGYRSIAQNQKMLENAMAETDKAAQPFLRVNPQLESGQMFDQDKYFSDVKYMQDAMAKEQEAKKQRALKRGFYQPDFDVFAEEMSYAGGGIAGIRRPSAIPPQSGPLPDGLPGVLKRVKNI